MKISSRERWRCDMQRDARLFCRPDLNETNKTIGKHHRPKHQQRNISTEVECKTGPQHEQHEAQKRISLLPPTDEQTRPNRHDNAGNNRAKKRTKIQDATADHPRGNSGVNSTLWCLQATPFRVVKSD